jgi:hypothetical protein
MQTEAPVTTAAYPGDIIQERIIGMNNAPDVGALPRISTRKYLN